MVDGKNSSMTGNGPSSNGGSNSSGSGERRPLSRRSRGERTRRRERYMQMPFLLDDDDDDDVDYGEGDGYGRSQAGHACTKCGTPRKSKRSSSSTYKTITSNHANSTKPTKDHLYKILVIGDLGSGKTSIIKRYVHDFFSQHYRATIGVDFALKVLHWDANTVIRLQLWDIAGQERYGNMTRVYYKEAVGAFIVFDVTRSNTFESVTNWKADLDSKVQLPDGSSIPCVLLGNKCDQQKEGICNNANKMNEFCKEKGFSAWFETSAKENINIEEATNALIKEILSNDVINANNAAKDKEQFTLTQQRKEESVGQKCFKC